LAAAFVKGEHTSGLGLDGYDHDFDDDSAERKIPIINDQGSRKRVTIELPERRTILGDVARFLVGQN